jgi:hypothetical protein
MKPLRLSLLLLAGTSACSDNFLEPKTIDPTNIDDRLSLKGHVCTSLPDPNGFPVKVVLIVDQSGSMCISDPPGSQMMGSFCADALAPIAANLPPEPARVRAMKKLFAQFAMEPNVSIAIVPFETQVKGVWPMVSGAGQSRFESLSGQGYADAITRVDQLQSELGKGTDYQGALAYTYGLIAADIVDTEMASPELLPRTRYVVVFLTDGTPFPRCSANDELTQYADSAHPDLTYQDSSGAGCVPGVPPDPTTNPPTPAGGPSCYCNLVDPMDPDLVTGFVAGTDRNQNYQLFSYVDQLMQLKATHNIGDIRLHTVLVFNEQAVNACGMMCTDVYGTYPMDPSGSSLTAAHLIATWLLEQMANRGNGIFQEFKDNLGVANLSLGALDYSSLASKNVMKTLYVRSMSADPAENDVILDRILDADGDGLPDDLDNNFTPGPTGMPFNISKFAKDSDGDCFDDNFEMLHYDDGFRPDIKDGRGCDPASPLTPNCTCRDTDGDGLSSFAEDYLHTRSTLVDSDGDGVPDGEEVRYALDPLSAAGVGLDTDGDGMPDRAEFRSDSNPTRRDVPFVAKNGYEYEITPTDQANGSVCYDFTVSNLQLVSPESQAGVRHGFNHFKVWFAEAPESGVASDYGVWRTACAWAQYAPPSVRDPAGPSLTFKDSDFQAPSTMVGDPLLYKTSCVGTPP